MRQAIVDRDRSARGDMGEERKGEWFGDERRGGGKQVLTYRMRLG